MTNKKAKNTTGHGFSIISRSIHTIALILSTFAGLVPSSVPGQEQPKRAWEPRDSIALRYFSQSTDWPDSRPSPDGDSEVNLSPDGEHFFVISYRGNLEADSTECQLQVFDASSIRVALAGDRTGAAPRIDLIVSSLTEQSPMRQVRWSKAGDAIFFLAAAKNGSMQLHRLDLSTAKTTQITNFERDAGQGVSNFEEGGGGTIVCMVTTKSRPLEPMTYPMEVVKLSYSRWGNSAFLYDRDIQHGQTMKLDIYVQFAGQAPCRFESTEPSPFLPRFVISPDGQWVAYFARATGDVRVVDARTGKIEILGKSNGGGDVFGDLSNPVVKAATAAAGAQWQNSSLVVFPGKPATSYTLENGKWVGRIHDDLPQPFLSAPKLRGFEVRVVQGTNEPPVLVASSGEKKVSLSEPDPVLQAVWWARQEPFSWTEPNGDIVTGGLLLPRDYKPGTRLPLVIQNYWYWPGVFLPDGPHAGTVDCAQSLVARGFAVLQIDGSARKLRGPDPGGDGVAGTPAEGPAFVEKIDAAVAALVEKGIVDGDHVGLTGFSRGGFHAYFAITHPGRTKLAAAIMDDSYQGSYQGYLEHSAMVGDTERVNGGSFWKNKDTWLEQETSFNIDRVRTPALFTNHTTKEKGRYYYTSDAMSTIGAFLINRRPIEWLVFPRGAHMMNRPRQSLVLHGAVVDWMCFWLKGEIPSDPVRAARWAVLRQQQDEVLKTPPPPKGKWVFVKDPVQPKWHPPAETKKTEEPKPEPTGAKKN